MVKNILTICKKNYINKKFRQNFSYQVTLEFMSEPYKKCLNMMMPSNLPETMQMLTLSTVSTISYPSSSNFVRVVSLFMERKSSCLKGLSTSMKVSQMKAKKLVVTGKRYQPSILWKERSTMTFFKVLVNAPEQASGSMRVNIKILTIMAS